MADLTKLHPTFRRKVKAIISDLKGHSLQAVVASAFRSPEQQARLYAVGRGEPGQPYEVSGLTVIAPTKQEYPRWKIVTKAKPFRSAHQWGLAVDFAWIVNGKWQYEAADEWWQLLYRSARAHECEEITQAVPWDKGHIQWKAWHVVKANLNNFIALYQSGGLKKVWAELDERYAED